MSIDPAPGNDRSGRYAAGYVCVSGGRFAGAVRAGSCFYLTACVRRVLNSVSLAGVPPRTLPNRRAATTQFTSSQIPPARPRPGWGLRAVARD